MSMKRFGPADHYSSSGSVSAFSRRSDGSRKHSGRRLRRIEKGKFMSTMPPGSNSQAAAPGSGDLSQECIALFGQVLNTLADRILGETPFTPDLAGAIEPISRALRTVSETVASSASSHAKVSSDAARASLDEAFRTSGAREMLQAALAVAATPAAGNLLTTRSIQLASGARRIPWLEIIKEIANVLLDLLPIGGVLKKILQELLRILDKIFGGMPHEDPQ
jgi:hypothetical protein